MRNFSRIVDSPFLFLFFLLVSFLLGAWLRRRNLVVNNIALF